MTILSYVRIIGQLRLHETIFQINRQVSKDPPLLLRSNGKED